MNRLRALLRAYLPELVLPAPIWLLVALLLAAGVTYAAEPLRRAADDPCANPRVACRPVAETTIRITPDAIELSAGTAIDFADVRAAAGALKGYLLVRVQGEWVAVPYFALARPQ